MTNEMQVRANCLSEAIRSHANNGGDTDMILDAAQKFFNFIDNRKEPRAVKKPTRKKSR